MLTDEELMEIRNRAKLNDNRQIDPLPFARDVIKAVLAKAMPIPKQEPVAWLHDDPKRIDVIHSDVKKLVDASYEKHGFYSGVQRSSVNKTEHYTIPLYPHPQPAQEAAIPDYELIENIKEIWFKSGSAHIMKTSTAQEIINTVLSASPKPDKS